VTPSADVQINASGNTAAVLFGNPGTYSVIARYGAISGNSDVSVIDSTYNPGGGTPTYAPLTGDQVFITVSKSDSMGLIGLDFRFITEKTYACLNHTLLFDTNLSNGNLQLVFNSVMIPSDEFCTSGEDHASGGTALYPLEDGTHGLEVVLDGTTYSGSFTKTGSTISFNWPYSSGVTITPLILN
jgi:hypothetical protein